MGKDREKHKIIVVGLPSNSTNDDLMKLVKPFGNPLEAGLAVDAEGKPRGFGFVRFADEETQQAAIESLDKTNLHGRTLNVRAVEERSSKDGPRAAGGGKKDSRPCFDFARGKCARGSACKWAHVLAAGAENSRRPDWQKPRATGIESAAEVLNDIPDDYCRKYQLGKCHRGAACRWKHVIWKNPAESGERGAPREGEVDGESAFDDDDGDSAAALVFHGKAARREGAEGLGDAKRARLAQSGAARLEALRAMLVKRESEWQRQSGTEAGAEAVPARVKNRDVVWRAMERMLAKISE